MKYTLVNWSYNEIGRWLTISSTDFETARQIAELCQTFIRACKRIRYERFSKDGGKVVIEGIETHPQQSDINAFLTAHFVREGWKADRRAQFSFSRTERTVS